MADSGTTDGVERVVGVLQQLDTLVNAACPLTYVTVTLLSKWQCTVNNNTVIIIFIIYKAQYPNMLKALYITKYKAIYYVLKLILIIINTTVKLTFR